MITGRGVLYLLLLAVTGLGVAYSGNSQLYVIFTIALLLPFISAFQVIRLRSLVSIAARLEKVLVIRQDDGSMKVDIGLSGRFMSGLIRMSILKADCTGRLDTERRWIALMPAASLHLQIRLPTLHRGIYHAGPDRMMARDLFGFFGLPLLSAKACQALQRSLMVLPRPNAFDPLTDLTESLSQMQHENAWQIGSDLDTIANIRSQQPGDSLKRAHWKLSARLDKMMIKEFENPRRMESLLILDLAAVPSSTLSEQEYGDCFTDCAAHVCKVVLAVPCSLRTVSWQPEGRQEVFAENLADDHRVQLMLAGLQPTGRRSADRVLAEEFSLNRNARLVILMTGRINEAIAQQLMVLRLLQRAVCLILVVPDQAQMPELDDQVSRLKAGGIIVYRTLAAAKQTQTKEKKPAKPSPPGEGGQS